MDKQQEYIRNLSESERKEYLEYKQRKKRMSRNYQNIEKGFQRSAFIVWFFLALCFIPLPSLRNYLLSIGVYVVDSSTFIVTIAAFVLNYLGRKASKNISSKYLSRSLHPKSQIRMPYQMKEKLQEVGDNIYDLLYHTAMWGISLALFSRETWFPHVLGGDGEYLGIFKDYPRWPAHQKSALVLLQVQFGTYLYLTVDVLLFNQQTFRKINYGQLLFHHSITISLLSICLFFNYIQVGIIIAFLHDFSDSLRCLTRLVGDLRISFLNPSIFTLSFYISFGFWIYTRLLVFPLCVIVQIVEHIPSWDSDIWFNLPAVSYCILLTVGLYFLQCYWAVLLHRSYHSENLKNRQFLEDILVGKRQQ